jgi:carboxyl-terminal processing protease
MDSLKRYLPAVLLAIIILFAFAAGFVYSLLLPDKSTELPADFDLLSEVWQLLTEDYVNIEDLDPAELSKGAVEGMLEALGDPYTAYIESHEMGLSDLEGSFEGVGAYVSMEDGQLTVVSPITGGPAEREGIRANDMILEVDGESTADMSLMEAIMKIRGPQGSTVTLTILHEGETDPIEISIVREEIQLESVYLDVLPENIAHLQITHFEADTTGEFTSALSDAIDAGVSGIILDLRGNPGGYLHIVVDIADEFLDGGMVLYEADDEGNVIDEYPATAGGMATEIPVVVLVDGGSASGSEVLAGALRDNGRATIIGTTTYGKGSVNILRPLSDGSGLYITIARWLTPDHHLIEGIGLVPDIEVELTGEDIDGGLDTQLEYAIEYLQSHL